MSAIASEIGYKPSETKREPMFFVVSVKKLIVMHFFTLGLYLNYWSYRNWVAYRQSSGEKVNPLLRAVFPVLFLYPLLARVDRQIKAQGQRYEWSPVMLVMGFVLITLLSFSLDLGQYEWTEELLGQVIVDLVVVFDDTLTVMIVALLLIAVQLWLASTIQRAINFAEGDRLGAQNSSFTLLNWAWMAIGILYWLLTVGSIIIWLILSWTISQH
ncbi:hypothetical protein [Pseudomonas sp. H9]|uniref:hypothetical protein n=1 Tax=Pseudomonas sp. H9 TaxID=483968 RepID=UPI00105781F6|nr:hypothetical protein [Pseudomonas sp. H9]TDF85117.1 hypothetical protein E1573_05600 [Pseudomonas sp. H9]